MEYVLLLSLFAGLSIQLPHPVSTRALQRRGHSTSAYSTSLQRSGSIVDNQRQKYLFPISVGDQTLNVELDTGSSDTWIIQTGFQCYNTYDNSKSEYETPEAQSVCNFGPTYTPGSEFSPVKEIFQHSCYGGSSETTLRCVDGPFGYAAVSLAGLDVPQQLIGAPLLVCFAPPPWGSVLSLTQY